MTLAEYHKIVLEICDDADKAMEREESDRQTILENMIDELRAL